jgi:F-type H+-transporting ATPase subunit b
MSQHGDEKHVDAHAAGSHGADSHAASSHAGEHHQEFNWFHGMIGVKEGEPASLLWRPPGTPPPFGALLLNTCLLFFVIFKVAKAPVLAGLRTRRQKISSAIDDAAAMKKEAELQLASYQTKLDNLGAEIERVKREMREGAEADRRRVLDEAKARRARIEQEARQLVEQELEALRDQLTRETSLVALRSARELLKKNTSTEDHRRICEQYLERLRVDRPSAARGERS